MGDLFTFEHQLPVNDGAGPSLDADSLWQGLCYRAYKPQVFLPQLVKAHVEQLEAQLLHRVLDFGSHQVEDHVVFYPQERIEVSSAPGQPMTFSHTLEIVLSTELLLVSRYQRPSVNDPNMANADDYLAQAYTAADREMLQQLRTLMTQGLL